MSSPLGALPQPPLTDAGSSYRFTAPWGGWFSIAQGILQDVSNAGTTAQRPTSNLYIGKEYFDTTVGCKIAIKSLNPTVWVNGIGTTV